MRLEVKGIEYDNFISASCEIRLDALSNTFSFNAALPEGSEMPFKGGDSCRVLVDGVVVLTGHIEVIEVSYSGDSHSILVSGRDNTADLLDSTISNIDDLRADNLTLKSIIDAVIKNIGSNLKVIDRVNPAAFDPAEDLASPEPGDNAFSFIEKYSRKRQVLLTSDADGNVVIDTNTATKALGAVQHIIGADDNNVIESNFRFDTTGRFNVYKLTSQLSPLPLIFAGDIDLASLVNQVGGALDSSIREGRQMILVSETSSSSTLDEKRARWEADIRRARGLVYSATVPGFKVGFDTGDLWEVNNLYQIVDDYLGKSEPMLCNSIAFLFNAEEGKKTKLGFVDESAYKISLPDEEKPETSQVATKFIRPISLAKTLENL